MLYSTVSLFTHMYDVSSMQITNLNSGLLSKTIEIARSMDMSSLCSSLIVSVCIKQESKAQRAAII